MKVLSTYYYLLFFLYSIVFLQTFDIVISAKLSTKNLNETTTTLASIDRATRTSLNETSSKPAASTAITTTNGLSANQRKKDKTTKPKSATTAADSKRSIASTTKTTKITTTTATKQKTQPPKKYAPLTKTSSSNNISNGPTKITLTKTNAIAPTIALTCPKESEAKFNLFAPPCSADRDCTAWNKEERCCKLFGSKNCYLGVPKPAEEPKHDAFFGIPRKCPERPLAELWWDLKTCDSDSDCWPRICCPDGQKKYCRSSTIEYGAVPFSMGRPIAYLSEFLECTPPPPLVFDLHPKECNSTLDCFPNVCCQEAGKRHCRPPKKSVLTLMANVFNVGLIRRLTNNLVIR